MDTQTLAGKIKHLGGNFFTGWGVEHSTGMTPDKKRECMEDKTIFLQSVDDILAQELPEAELVSAIKTFVDHARTADWTNPTDYAKLYTEYKTVNDLANRLME